MRLKSEIWVKAYLRRLGVEGISVFVVRRGHEAAGSIYIKVNLLDGMATLFTPAPVGLGRSEEDLAADSRRWVAFGDERGSPEQDVDVFLQQEAVFDTDIWVIEVEDPKGRHFLDEQLTSVL